MKIKTISMTDFMGITGTVEIELPHITALIGANGTGKTTLLNALRYGLTGAEPAGDIINKNADECTVSFTIDAPMDGMEYSFTRIKNRNKPAKYKVCGKTSTLKLLNEKLESVIGIPLDKINILSSSEVVSALPPAELSSFLLDYIPERLGVDDVIAFIPDITPAMETRLRALAPASDINLNVISDLDEMLRSERKNTGANLDTAKAILSSKPSEKPAYSKADLEQQMLSISNTDAAYQVYLAKKNTFEKNRVEIKKQNDMLSDLEAQIKGISATRPDPTVYAAAVNSETSTRDTIKHLNVSISSSETAINQLRKSLENLNNPVCPLSDKIVCKQDKSAARNELQSAITDAEKGVSAAKHELDKAEAALEKALVQKNDYQTNYNMYSKKMTLSKQYKAIYDNRTKEMPEPEMVKPADTAALKAEIQQKFKLINDYEEGLTLADKVNKLQECYSTDDALVKTFAEKGPVRAGIIKKYNKVFEDLCNEISSKARPDYSFEFTTTTSGTVILMNNGSAKLPYNALSGGEKAYMIFILMSMLNSLTGCGILYMDELSVADSKCFNALLNIVSAYGEDYDCILIAAVNHEDTVKAVQDHKIPVIDKIINR